MSCIGTVPLRTLVVGLGALVLAGCALAQASKGTIRICDDQGCSDRPIDSATFKPEADDPQAERRIAALEQAARKDPRAAYDLGLRYFRGDGVKRNSHQALQWMRDAADRGDLQAQKAVGKLYLSGLEEMGSDPQEAEKWLSMAAARGDKEARKLLSEASAAKQSEQSLYRWQQQRRKELSEQWYRGWSYRTYWSNGVWLYY